MTKEGVSYISIGANFGLGLLKVVLGVWSGSTALLAEGIHSVMDLASSGITLWGVKISQRRPTPKHPYGWGRAEVLAGLAVTVFLALAGIGIIQEAVGKMLYGGHEARITFIPLLVMLISVVVNEFSARLKIYVGQREESLALIADGKHSRVDVYSSGAALAGIFLARYLPIADSITAFFIGLFVLYETFNLGKEVTESLLDVADPEVESQIKKVCQAEQVDLVDLKTRKIGSLVFAELKVAVPAEVKAGRVSDLVGSLQAKLMKKIPHLEYVVIQIQGRGRRSRMLRGRCAESLDKIGPAKKGWRVAIPYREGKVYEDFGAPEYLVVDYDKQGEEVMRQIIKNPYYKIGRGHGIRFVKAVGADEVKTVNIGENARKTLGELGIKVSLSESDFGKEVDDA